MNDLTPDGLPTELFVMSTEPLPPNTYPTEPIVNAGELHDPFALPGGGRLSDPIGWPEQAKTWLNLILEKEYGGFAPAPEKVEVEPLCQVGLRLWPESPRLYSYRLHCQCGSKAFSFAVQVLFPRGEGPFPAVINGDGCWRYISDDVARSVLARGFALVTFNRTEMAPDQGSVEVTGPQHRNGGLYEVYPGHTFGALSAWAWGHSRCVDLACQLPFIADSRLAVNGHSRGGKAALLAGATDQRIAATNDNSSCAGGSAAFRYVGDGGETLNIVNAYPAWFGEGLRPFVKREQDLPFDQHCLLAAIAPRSLLLTYALDDRWSNPEGMVQCAKAVKEVYQFLGQPERFAFHLRKGKHQHDPEDWNAFLDFLDWQWNDKIPERTFNQHPYTHLAPPFSWKAPRPSERLT